MPDQPHQRQRQDGKLLLEQARVAVRGPLRFGDDEQIRAARFLAEVDRVYQHTRKCSDCLSWTVCSGGLLTASPDVADAAWALIEGDGGPQGIAEAALSSGETNL